MKIGSKVELKQSMQLIPVGASTPRGADLRNFDKGAQFTLVNIEGEKAIVKDDSGNFWTVLLQFLGLVQDISQVNSNTTLGESVTIGTHIVNFFKSIVNAFRKKKK